MCFVLCRAECTDLWNAYFDEHDIDFILTPSLWSDVTYYTEGVRGVRPLNVKQSEPMASGFEAHRLALLRNGSLVSAFCRALLTAGLTAVASMQ